MAADAGTPDASVEVDAGQGVSPEFHVVEYDGGTIGVIRVENVALSSGHEGSFDTYNNLWADFVRRVPCATTQLGECVVEECTGAVVADYAARASAGLLTFTGFEFGGVPGPTLAVFPYGSGSPRPNTMWDGGEPIVLIATGDVVPPFEVQVTAPSPFVVTEPPCTPYCERVVDRAQPLTVTWTAAPIGDVVVALAAGPRDRTGYLSALTATTVRCRAAVGSTGLTVPSELLQRLPRTEGLEAMVSLLSVRRVSGIAFDAGPWAVTFEADWVALSSSVPVR